MTLSHDGSGSGGALREVGKGTCWNANPNICYAVRFSTQLWRGLQPAVTPPRLLQLTDGSMGNQPICVCTCILFRIRVRANRFVPSRLRTYVLVFVCVCVCVCIWREAPRDIRMSWLWYVPDSLCVLEELKCHLKEINTAELCVCGGGTDVLLSSWIMKPWALRIY